MSDTDQTTEPEGGKASREAARYRVALREVEAERDALRSTVQAFRQAEVTRLAGQHLADPDDLFTIGKAEVDALLAEDGTVDVAKVEAATTALLDARPYLMREDEVTSFDGGARQTTAKREPSWSSVLSGGRK